MTVFNLKAGEEAYISRINLLGGAQARLSALGIVEGEKITALSFSLFKSSVLVSCAAVRVGMRKKLAENIEVTRTKPEVSNFTGVKI